MKTQVLTTKTDHQLAACLLAALLSLTIFSTAWSQTANKQLALAETKNTIVLLNESEPTVSFYANAETDSPNPVEEWMSSDDYWGTVDSRFETDKELQIELWMYCDYYWTGKICKELLEPKSDELLTVEEWMYNDRYWRGK